MQAAHAALSQLQTNPHNDEALHDYNFATARILGIIRDAKLDPWTQPLSIPTNNGLMILTHKPDPRPQWNPALYRFAPADQFDISGKYVEHHTTRSGIGASLVAIGQGEYKEWRANYFLKKVYYGVTAVVAFKGNKCIIDFLDPLNKESIKLGTHLYPLAADFTVPIAVMLAETTLQTLKFQRLLFPQKYAESARISRLEPYNSKKIVVLVIHGLMDSPSTWAPMINNLRNDLEIRKHYQFWFYSYPSGYPYPYSAAILRHELDGIEKKYPLHHKIVVIGHSMGGCISRLLITETGGYKLWKLQFGKTPDQMRLSAASKKLLLDSLVFHHRSEIGRVIFISAPLKGSDLARISLGRIGSSLIRTPTFMISAGTDVIKNITFQPSDLKLKRPPNSIDTLSPNNRFVLNINKIPVVSGIPYHTIMGDRGKGNAPHSSDGIVPYWSSHMDGAVSECIVDSDHMAHQKPQTFAEVTRILKLNLESQ